MSAVLNLIYLQCMVVTPSGPPGHHVLIRVAVGKNLDHVLAQILLQCMEGMTAKSMERVLSLPHAWKDIVVVRYNSIIEKYSPVSYRTHTLFL